jgi:hypothetical protein
MIRMMNRIIEKVRALVKVREIQSVNVKEGAVSSFEGAPVGRVAGVTARVKAKEPKKASGFGKPDPAWMPLRLSRVKASW